MFFISSFILHYSRQFSLYCSSHWSFSRCNPSCYENLGKQSASTTCLIQPLLKNVLDAMETKLEAFRWTVKAELGRPDTPDSPPKWFLEYMEAVSLKSIIFCSFFYLCSVVYLAFEIILKIDWRFFRVCFVDIIRLWAASYFETGYLRKMLFITVRKVHQDFVSDSNSLPIIVHSRIFCNFSRVRYVSSRIKYEIFRVGNICWYLQKNMELRAFQKYTENLKYFMQVLNLVL